MNIGVICDVGSMNGADALVFSAAAPESRVYAFELRHLLVRALSRLCPACLRRYHAMRRKDT